MYHQDAIHEQVAGLKWHLDTATGRLSDRAKAATLRPGASFKKEGTKKQCGRELPVVEKLEQTCAAFVEAHTATSLEMLSTRASITPSKVCYSLLKLHK